ncbi:MAG: class I SAM-dependent methyltransferase [Lewinellaceae bacterium]|nr:class I SAM-dependent methyltransferase [Lewinellaceae bacterium]
MPNASILQHYTSLHAAYLHANGERGTEYLLQQIHLNGTERVLEMGFGTGATLVKLKSRYPDLRLSGIEADPAMIKKAAARLRFCGLRGRVSLLHTDDRLRIPSGSVDLVYVESVLAILDENILAETLRFLASVLKPGGILAINESIWHREIPCTDIREINKKCLETFGIIQCTEQMTGVEATSVLFEKYGFKTLAGIRISVSEKSSAKRQNYREYLSALFTLLGKLRLYLQPELRKKHTQYSSEMRQIFEPGREYLSGTFMLFQKTGLSAGY